MLNFIHIIAWHIKNYIFKPESKKTGPFSDIFFDKFKNLLDDYIVNYQIKYFFYLLFISFFYLELSEGLFQLLHNYSPYHLSIFGSFLIDFCNTLCSFEIVEFAYSFFLFQVTSFVGLISFISNHSTSYAIPILTLIAALFAQADEYIKVRSSVKYLDVKLIVFLFSLYSFLFFVLIWFHVISINYYIFLTAIFLVALALHPRNGGADFALDGFAMLGIMFIAFLPYKFIFFLFVMTSYMILNRDILFYSEFVRLQLFRSELKMFLNQNLLLISVLFYYVLHLNCVYFSLNLYVFFVSCYLIALLCLYLNDDYHTKLKKYARHSAL